MGAGQSPGSIPEKPWSQVLPLWDSQSSEEMGNDQCHDEREQEGITQVCLQNQEGFRKALGRRE